MTNDTPAVPTQRDLVRRAIQQTLTFDQEASSSRAHVGTVLDHALHLDQAEHEQAVFGGTQTPRASARRALYDLLDANTLLVRDGRGFLRFRLEDLQDATLHGPVHEVLKLCPDNSLPIVIADPPWDYIKAHTSIGTKTRMIGPSMRWFETTNLPLETIQEIYRVAKPGGVFLCWLPPFQDAAEEQWAVLQQIRAVGFRSLREVTWVKGKGGGYGWAPSSEPCFIFYKGHRPKFYDLSVTNVLHYPRLRACDKTPYADYGPQDDAAWKAALAQYGSYRDIPESVRDTLKERTHSCEKPVPVLRDLLKPVLTGPHGRAAAGDDLVVDLYAGSGSASLAAVELGAHFVAVELDERTFMQLLDARLSAHARKRIAVPTSTRSRNPNAVPPILGGAGSEGRDNTRDQRPDPASAMR